ncbi:hypothetical protein ACEWY4_023479 [Coilia grayii]|uniref:Caspase-8 n=1 Tax=Coilia grayii TaxID=363190 RepID=A0ABD1J355_9TELE
MEFQKVLLDLEQSLSEADFQALKFLCVDLLHKDVSSLAGAGDLFSILMDRDHLSNENRSLLTELFQTCHRQDLIRKQSLPTVQPGEFCISPYRKLLFGLSENITEKDLKSMKFLLNKTLPRKKLQDEMTTLQLLLEMEKEDILNRENLDMLRWMLTSICPCLTKRIDQFKRETGQRPNHLTDPMNIGPVCEETGGKMMSQLDEAAASYQAVSNQHPSCEVLLPPSHFCNEAKPSFEESGTEHAAEHPEFQSALTEDLENMSLQSSTVDDEVQSHQLSFSSFPRSMNLKDDSSPSGASAAAAEVELPKYDMKGGDRRGVCFIINNYNFSRSVKVLGDRNGTEYDERALEAVFSWLKFDVEIWNDCTQQEMLSLLTGLSQRDHSTADCLVCCVLSHGKEGSVYGVDGHEVRLTQLTDPFSGHGCRSLREKPKLFFIQACQGNKEQQMVTIQPDGPIARSTSVDAEVPDQQSSAPSIPAGADFLLGMATLQEYASFRDKKEGTWFIQSLCEKLQSLVPLGVDLLSILTEVNNDVSRKAAGAKKQMPQPVYSLRKRVVFPIPSNPAPHSLKHRTV